MIYFLYKRKFFLKRLGKPNFGALVFEGSFLDHMEAPDSARKAKLAELESLLVNDNFKLTRIACDVTASTEMDKLSKSIAFVFYRNNSILEFLKIRAVQEVKEASTY